MDYNNNPVTSLSTPPLTLDGLKEIRKKIKTDLFLRGQALYYKSWIVKASIDALTFENYRSFDLNAALGVF